VVTWFTALTNQMHSARSVPHFTFRIPHSAIPHFTDTRNITPSWGTKINFDSKQCSKNRINNTHVLFGISSLTTGVDFSFQSSMSKIKLHNRVKTSPNNVMSQASCERSIQLCRPDSATYDWGYRSRTRTLTLKLTLTLFLTLTGTLFLKENKNDTGI